MNKEEILNRLNLKINSIIKKGKCTIIDTNDGKYVIKDTIRKSDFYEYLLSRNFNNFPEIYTKVGDKIELSQFIDENNVPIEQKIEDIIYITSILHRNTVYDKNLDIDSIKEIYEDLMNKQNYLMDYYQNLQNIIEEEVYMSPANYYLIRNISLVYFSINKSKEYLDKWYKIVEDNKSIRYSYIHGNLKKEHLIEGNNLYLISWDKSRIDLPLYDLDLFYRNSFENINLDDLLGIYQNKFPLKKEEFYLLLSLLLLPTNLNLKQDEYLKVKQVSNLILYLESIYKYLKNNSEKSNNNTNEQQKN